MAGVPNVFGNATTTIPLVQLDQNFATPITIGSTTVGLGNTVSTLNAVALGTGTPAAVTATTVWQSSRNAYTSFAQFNPTGTTSATKVMMGLGSSWALTPSFSGRVRVMVVGYFTLSTTFNSTEQLDIYYGTGSAPANGAAATGTAAGVNIVATVQVAGVQPRAPVSLMFEVSGLTLATAYWFDLGMSNSTAGIASVSVASIIIEEF